MKIKGDFVTNSSSTGFILMFKGNNKIRFYQNLVEHADKFKLTYDRSWSNNSELIHCDVWDIIEAIDPLIRKDEGPDRDIWIMKGIEPIEIIQKRYNDELSYIKEELKKDDTWYTEEELQESINNVDKVERAISKGFTHYYDIDAGNDGNISGNLGDILDYAGRYLDIDDDTLILITEQRR